MLSARLPQHCDQLANGSTVAETVARERVPDILLPFGLSRFEDMALINEMGATAASH